MGRRRFAKKGEEWLIGWRKFAQTGKRCFNSPKHWEFPLLRIIERHSKRMCFWEDVRHFKLVARPGADDGEGTPGWVYRARFETCPHPLGACTSWAQLCVATLSKLARPSDQQPLILEPFAPPGQRLSSLSSALTRCKMNQNKRQHQRVLERLVAHVGGVLRRTGKTEALTCAKKRKRRFDHSIVIRNLWPFFLEAEMLSMPESLQHLGCDPQNAFGVLWGAPGDWTQALLWEQVGSSQGCSSPPSTK